MIRVVKFLCTLIIGLSLSSLRAADPGEAALAFLGKVRDGKLDLKPGGDTALLEHITKGKRESIRKRISRLEEELRGGELELGKVKEDGGYAAAMIRKTGGFDSAEMQVFPIALVKRGDNWFAAPIPASFENAVTGYTVPLKERLAALEDWMMRERVTDLERLFSESTKKTRELIRSSIIGDDLIGDDLGRISDRFLEACAKGDRAAILGFLGGLSDPLPVDWGLRLNASREAVGGGDNWRVLVSPEVGRVRVHEQRDKNDGKVSIACLDPQKAVASGLHLVHLSFSRDSTGQWRIDLPDALLLGVDDSDDEGFDEELLDDFSEKLREVEPALYEDSSRSAATELMKSLKSGGIHETLRRIDLGKRPKDGRKACLSAADLWWSLNTPGSIRMPVELGFREVGNYAVYTYQWFSLNEADIFNLRSLYFRKTEQGWLFCPGFVPKETDMDQATLAKWIEATVPAWRLSWRETLMRPSVKLDPEDFGKLATDEEVRVLVEAWRGAMERTDLGAALACSAWFGGGEGIPINALRNISYDIMNPGWVNAELAAIHRSESWVMATIRRVSGGRSQHAFLTFAVSPAGVRILPEIDLIMDDTRTRKFLNNASFERLGKKVAKDKVLELQGIFEESSNALK